MFLVLTSSLQHGCTLVKQRSEPAGHDYPLEREGLSVLLFPFFFLFQDGLNSDHSSCDIQWQLCGVWSPQSSLPRELSQLEPSHHHSQAKGNPVTYSHSKLPLFRPEASAKPRVADEMDLFAKTLFAASQTNKETCWRSQLSRAVSVSKQTQEGSVSFSLYYLYTNLTQNDFSTGQTSFSSTAWKRKTADNIKLLQKHPEHHCSFACSELMLPKSSSSSCHCPFSLLFPMPLYLDA